MENKKTCHLKELLRNGYLLYALALTAVLTTISVFAIDFGYLSTFRSIQGMPYFLIATFSLLGLFVIFYFIFRAKTKAVSFADCLSITLFLSSLLVGGYAYFLAKKWTLAFLIVDGAICLLGLVFSIIFAIRCAKRNEKRDIIFTSNTLVGYYTNVFRKYRFLGVLTLAILSISATYIFFDNNYLSFALQFVESIPLVRYLILACISLFGAWLAVDASRRRVSVIDAFLLSNVATIPVSFLQIYLINQLHTTQFTIWAVYVGVILIVSLVRFLSFDITRNYAEEDAKSKCYISAVCKKINPLALLTTLALIVMFGVFTYVSEIYLEGIKIADDAIAGISIQMWPYALIVITGATLVVFGFISSIFLAGRKKVGAVDFFVLLNLLLGCCGAIGYIWINNFIYLISCLGFIFINLILLVIRIRFVRENLKR